MNDDPHHRREDALLNAVLEDGAWAEVNATAKSAALAQFHAMQRRRRLTQFALAVVSVLLIGGIVSLKWTTPAAKVTMAQVPVRLPSLPQMPASDTPAAARPPTEFTPHYISQEEMVALLPRGSCTIVLVHGKPELVILDPQVEKEGVNYTRALESRSSGPAIYFCIFLLDSEYSVI